MPENFLHSVFQPSAFTADQVIDRLTSEIGFLYSWLINSGEDYDSKIFVEKLQLLRDKIEEREKFEKISEEENEAIN